MLPWATIRPGADAYTHTYGSVNHERDGVTSAADLGVDGSTSITSGPHVQV